MLTSFLAAIASPRGRGYEPGGGDAWSPRRIDVSFSPGGAVMVQWSDGNQYPAQVVQHQSGHVLVSFPGGQQQWIPEHHVVPSHPPAGYPPADHAPADHAPAGAPLDDDVREELAEIEQTIRQFESQGTPLAGVDPADPVTIWTQVFALARLEEQGISRDQAAQQLGFAGGGG